MNNEELKKLLKSVEVCEGNYTNCDGCPFEHDGMKYCSEIQHRLAKKLLQEMKDEPEQEKTTVYETKAIIFGDQTTRNVVLEWLHDGGDMIVGYKPAENYKQWLVGHVVTIDLAKATVVLMGVSTGVISRFRLDRDARLIKWEGGPTADLICIDEVGRYKLGECYHMYNGKMSADQIIDSEQPFGDGRFASLDDEFIKKHFAQWRGCVESGNSDLNGFFVCKESSCAFTKGKRYMVSNGYFRDDHGNTWDELVSKYITLAELADEMKLYYVPDKD